MHIQIIFVFSLTIKTLLAYNNQLSDSLINPCDGFDLNVTTSIEDEQICYNYELDTLSSVNYLVLGAGDLNECYLTISDIYEEGIISMSDDELIYSIDTNHYGTDINGIKLNILSPKENDKSIALSLCFDNLFVGGTQKYGQIEISHADNLFTCPVNDVLPDFCDYMKRSKHDDKERRRKLLSHKHKSAESSSSCAPVTSGGLPDPVPGIPYEFEYQGRTQRLTLNENVLYFNCHLPPKCVITFDADGNLDSSESYIELIHDPTFNDLKIGDVLLATLSSFEWLDINCTLFPAVVITDIIKKDESSPSGSSSSKKKSHSSSSGKKGHSSSSDSGEENDILILKIREANMFEYIGELDINLKNMSATQQSNMTLFPDEILNEVVNIADESSPSNASMNISYIEYELICYNVTEDGIILNEIEIINGECDGMSTVDYFSQQQGIDNVQFNNETFYVNDTLYSVEPIDLNETYYGDITNINARRLLRKKWKKKWKKKMKKKMKKTVKVVKKVVKDVVDTIVDIVTGNIDKRIWKGGVYINSDTYLNLASNSMIKYQPGGPKSPFSILFKGSFGTETGIDFAAGIFIDFAAKYSLFKKNPTFDLFRLEIGGETRFNAYIDLDLNGKITFVYTFSTPKGPDDMRSIMIGPVPVLFREYAAVLLKFSVAVRVNLNWMFQIGYNPMYIKYGVEWNSKDKNWKSLSSSNLKWDMFKNSVPTLGENCFSFEVAPTFEIRFGVILYGILDLFLSHSDSLPHTYTYPATCNGSIPACKYDPLLFKVGIDYVMKNGINLNAKFPVAPKLDIIISFPLANIWEMGINIWENCYEQASLLHLGESICCPKVPTTTIETTEETSEIDGHYVIIYDIESIECNLNNNNKFEGIDGGIDIVVTCCDDNNNGYAFGCEYKNLNYYEAHSVCLGYDLRLCSSHEINTPLIINDDCQDYDQMYVWTDTECVYTN
eukprot:276846_1